METKTAERLFLNNPNEGFYFTPKANKKHQTKTRSKISKFVLIDLNSSTHHINGG